MKKVINLLKEYNWFRVDNPFVSLWIKNGLMVDLNEWGRNRVYRIRKKEPDGLYYNLITGKSEKRLSHFIKTLDHTLMF